MQIPVSLPTLSLSGYYSVLFEQIVYNNKMIAIHHYWIVLELSSKKNISLYRHLTGEWIIDFAESETDLKNELRRQIEQYESV